MLNDQNRLDELAAEAKQAADAYELMTGEKVPRTVRDAVNQDWLGVSNDIVSGILGHYDEDEKRRDAQRIISTPRAIEAIGELEDDLVEKLVSSPAAGVIRKFMVPFQIARVIVENRQVVMAVIGELVQAILANLWTLLKLILTGEFEQFKARVILILAGACTVVAAFIVAAPIMAGSTEVFKTGIKDLARLRDKSAAETRTEKLNQSTNSKRYYVKRRSRR